MWPPPKALLSPPLNGRDDHSPTTLTPITWPHIFLNQTHCCTQPPVLKPNMTSCTYTRQMSHNHHLHGFNHHLSLRQVTYKNQHKHWTDNHRDHMWRLPWAGGGDNEVPGVKGQYFTLSSYWLHYNRTWNHLTHKWSPDCPRDNPPHQVDKAHPPPCMQAQCCTRLVLSCQHCTTHHHVTSLTRQMAYHHTTPSSHANTKWRAMAHLYVGTNAGLPHIHFPSPPPHKPAHIHTFHMHDHSLLLNGRDGLPSELSMPPTNTTS